MGLIGTQVCTSRETHTHRGTIKHEHTIKDAVTDQAIDFLDNKAENLNAGIQAMIRHKTPFLDEVIITVEYDDVNRWFFMRYLFGTNFRRFYGEFKETRESANDLDDYYSEEQINQELAEIVARRVVAPIACRQFAGELYKMRDK